MMSNQLYQNMISYIVTDPMTSAQIKASKGHLQYYSYESGIIVNAESINYSILGSKVQPATDLIINAIGNGLTLSNNNFESSFQRSLRSINYSNPVLFYQFGGLNNIISINNNLVIYNQTYGSSGSLSNFFESYLTSESINAVIPLMSNESGNILESAIASVNTLQPYFVNANGYPQLFGSVTNNLSQCNGKADTIGGGLDPFSFYVYTPTGINPSLGKVGTPYLMCGNWSTTNMPTQLTNTNTTQVTTYYPSLAPTYGNYEGKTQIFYSNLVSNSPSNGYPDDMISQCLANPNSGGCGTFPMTGNMITLTNFNSTYWASSNNKNNSLAYGSSLNEVNTGWMNVDYPTLTSDQSVSNLAAAQITLPDGFIAPIVLVNTNIKGWSGNYIGIGYNPNVSSVMIDGQPLLDNSNGVGPASTTSWGLAPSTTLVSYNYGVANNMFIPAITVNNNIIMMNSNGWGSHANHPGTSYITINPINCPNAYSGAYGTDNNLLPSYVAPTNLYQASNFVCILPTYNGFFNQ